MDKSTELLSDPLSASIVALLFVILCALSALIYCRYRISAEVAELKRALAQRARQRAALGQPQPPQPGQEPPRAWS